LQMPRGDKNWELGLEAGDSLTAVMEKINAAGAGVRASLVDGHLIITGEGLGSLPWPMIWPGIFLPA